LKLSINPFLVWPFAAARSGTYAAPTAPASVAARTSELFWNTMQAVIPPIEAGRVFLGRSLAKRLPGRNGSLSAGAHDDYLIR